MRTLGTLLALSLLVVPTFAQNRPDTAEQAARSVLAAREAKDEAALAALAAKNNPDPWIVADLLCARGDHDAAAAYAKAAPRPDTEKLPAYVAACRKRTIPEATREAGYRAARALSRRDASAALAALEGVPEAPDVPSIRVLFVRGSALAALGRRKEAIDAFQACAEAAIDLGWLPIAIRALEIGGLRAAQSHDHRRAVDLWRRGLELAERRGHLRSQGWFAGNIGAAYLKQGELTEALPFLERNISLSRKLGDRGALTGSLINLAGVRYGLGDVRTAARLAEEGLELSRDLGNRSHEAAALGNLGVYYTALGEYEKALEVLRRSEAEQRKLDDRDGVAQALSSMAAVHHVRGQYQRALACHEQALELLEELGDTGGLIGELINLGTTYRMVGDRERARSLLDRALRLEEGLGNRRRLSITLVNLAGLHRDAGRHEEALSLYARAIEILEDIGPPTALSGALSGVGLVHDLRGEDNEALEAQQRALRIAEECGDRRGATIARGNVGNLYRKLGRPEDARRALDRALADGEELALREVSAGARLNLARLHLDRGEARAALRTLRAAVAVLPELVGGLAERRSALAREKWTGLYALGLRAALEVNDPEEACFFLESGRAGSLLESLGGRKTLRSATIPEKLRDREAEARGQEAVALARYRRALRIGEREPIRLARGEVAAARALVEDAMERIQRTSKVAADVVYPEAASLATIQGWLGKGDALVLYGHAAQPPELMALVVTPRKARIVNLGPSAGIESASSDLSVEDASKDPRETISRLRRLILDPLSLGPAVERLLVSPHGSLSYVPFTLLEPRRVVAYVPSGTAFGVFLDDRGRRGEGTLALGDPAYEARVDPRAAVAHLGGRRLVRLPATRQEAEAVGDVLLLGKDATEAGLAEAVTKRPRWRAVHIACHGLIDTERPTLSSLALAPGAENDGFLTCLEVFRMKVPADLVVLSACETAKGKVYKAEGIVGMTRAFMVAGAPRVICSLWPVDDDATKALMVKFYEQWDPEDGEGIPAAAALKRAQEHVRSHAKWKHPFYWAAWVLWGLPD